MLNSPRHCPEAIPPDQAHQGGINLWHGPKCGRWQDPQHFDLRQQLRDNGKRPIFRRAGLGPKPLGNLLLHRERQQINAGQQHFHHQRRCDLVGQIGHQLNRFSVTSRSPDRFQQRGTQCVLAVEGIAMDQREIGIGSQPARQQFSESGIDFDRCDARAASEQLFRQRSRAGPHLDHVIAFGDFAGISDEPEQIPVDHEILPEPMPGRRVNFIEERADFVLGLGHRYNSPTMKSFEVIRNAVDDLGAKAVASGLKLSAALVYKWCEPPAEPVDRDASGAKNPLDRVRELYLITKDIRLIRWLCNDAGGFFVSNPVPDLRKTADQAIFSETQCLVRDFSELLDAVTESVEDDSRVDAAEADRIREKWEDLKACVERFVISCEKGHYRSA